MQKIVINLKSTKPDDEIWEWLEKDLQKNLDRKAGIEHITAYFDKTSRKIDLKGRTISGIIRLDKEAVNIVLEIPVLYRFFVPHIKAAVTKIFDQL